MTVGNVWLSDYWVTGVSLVLGLLPCLAGRGEQEGLPHNGFSSEPLMQASSWGSKLASKENLNRPNQTLPSWCRHFSPYWFTASCLRRSFNSRQSWVPGLWSHGVMTLKFGWAQGCIKHWPRPCFQCRDRTFDTLAFWMIHRIRNTICFTIYLFISPDLDGHRAPKNGSIRYTLDTSAFNDTPHVYDMFVCVRYVCLFVCLFVLIYVSRHVCSLVRT